MPGVRTGVKLPIFTVFSDWSAEEAAKSNQLQLVSWLLQLGLADVRLFTVQTRNYTMIQLQYFFYAAITLMETAVITSNLQSSYFSRHMWHTKLCSNIKYFSNYLEICVLNSSIIYIFCRLHRHLYVLIMIVQ